MLTYFFTLFLIIYFLYILCKVKGDCDFSSDSLNLSVSEIIPKDEETYLSNIKYCVKFTKGFEILTFICPKKSINYEGIEVRPFNCFETVRINGRHENLGELLEGSVFKNSETDSTIVRKVFIPPLIKEDILFECTCDNSLTFKGKHMGSRGIMRVQLKKNKIFGCDFDHNGNITQKNPFIYHEKSTKNSNETIICNVIVNSSEVILGLICPKDYKLFPDNCFENVLHENKIVKISELVPHDLKLHTNEKERSSFASFTLNKNEKTKGFSCQCVKNKNSRLYAYFEFDLNYKSSSFHIYILSFIIFILFLILFFF
ncbi:6-cysteine protein, putative [Plasmodium gallinaceum]|uniref:6-cysteine protein, putative n=1 Tax=Plasmodium gallinaceum TaxID=5849 RepID=A0A1J1GMZ9_PLAGA|nr:6-cysteine protein, putative [Plasmodium gallinaceum]CRG93707.1 6-cysteine protein, putative [Plasmodium gallinaceum]